MYHPGMHNKSRSPAHSFTRNHRFERAKKLEDYLKQGPDPWSHNPSYQLDSRKRSSSSYSFGTGKRYAIDPKNKKRGKESPGPTYYYDISFLRPQSPSAKFAGRSDRKPGEKRPSTSPGLYITSLHSKSQAGSHSPGPIYAPEYSQLRRRSPSVKMVDPKRDYEGRELHRGSGADSPGPQYNAEEGQLHPHSPSFSFAGNDLSETLYKDNYMAQETLNFDYKGDIGPGPGHYTEDTTSTPRPWSSRSVSISGKNEEEQSYSSIFPSPKSIRFVSTEFAKENHGSYSPGPKYMIQSKMGRGPSATFSEPRSSSSNQDVDDESEKKELLFKRRNRLENRQYYGPISSFDKSGKDSPGPKYSPRREMQQPSSPAYSFTSPKRIEEQQRTNSKLKNGTQTQNETVDDLRWRKQSELRTASNQYLTKDIEKHSNLGRESPGPSVYRPSGKRLSKTRTSPSFTFGSSSKNQRNKGGKSSSSSINNRSSSSPGPVYCPNVAPIKPNSRSVSMGGLK
eukprot:gb/GECH01004689.1/.p1 GENE.gb/GECH01004689.1/~~gb/GECH01004689.1/.p1  ORF type:complete len:509 (+),score=123.02 gb/GECH01004689.1/:1-1527(+)